MEESTKRHEQNSNLIQEIRASTDAVIRNQGASIKTLEIQIGQMSKSISTTVEADPSSIRRIGSHQYADCLQFNTKKGKHLQELGLAEFISDVNSGQRSSNEDPSTRS
ncbi:hypothetical protein Tco_0694863 [Tanacetum coccineum]